jgi:hypothetical protein
MTAVTQSVVDLVAKLARGGCCVSVQGVGITMAVAKVWINGGRLYWCQLRTDDQHHVHAHTIADVMVYHGRDVQVTADDGTQLYFAPVAEWPDVNYGAWRAEWGRWQAMLADGDNAERFAKFCDEATGLVTTATEGD